MNVCLKKCSEAIAGQPAAADEKFVADAAAADRIESLPAHIDDVKYPSRSSRWSAAARGRLR